MKYKIKLGSGSPRRKELLGMMDLDFEVIKLKDVDESYPADMEPELVPQYLSKIKAQSYRDELAEDELLITADTVVILNGEILGKPSGRAGAIEMLHRLAGKTHVVVTGVTLTTSKHQTTFAEATEVEFAELTDEEIQHYVDRHKPFDKAGAYGVQEWLGATSVKGIKGCFYNVMGLPTAALYSKLKEIDKISGKGE